jgi:hypothetical protein
MYFYLPVYPQNRTTTKYYRTICTYKYKCDVGTAKKNVAIVICDVEECTCTWGQFNSGIVIAYFCSNGIGIDKFGIGIDV